MADEYEVVLVLRGRNEAEQVLGRVEQRLQSIDRHKRTLRDSTDQLVTRFNRLENAAFGFIGAFAGSQILQAIGDLNRMGAEANALENEWELLAEELGDAPEILQRLRSETRGAASDMELMAGANQLMRLQIAQSEDELVELTTLISRLKDPTVSTGEAINNFALMLSNQSIMRLDSFGLSAARARERIAELTAAGMDSQAAFNTAVIEQMREQNERLTPAIDANITAIQRFQASWDNFISDVGQGVNNTLNEALTTLEMLGQIVDAWVQQQRGLEQEAQELDALVFARSQIIGQQFMLGFETSLDPEVIMRFISEAVRRLQTDPELASRMDITEMFGMAGLPLLPGREPNPETAQQLAALLSFTAQKNAEMEQAVVLMDQQRARAEAINAAVNARTDAEIATRQELEAQQAILDAIAPAIDGMEASMQELAALTSSAGRGEVGGIVLFSPEEAQRAQELLASFEQARSNAEQLHEQGLISDEQLESLMRGADEVKRMADEARRGADAFEDMTLNQALLGGTEQNELLGGLSDQLLAALEDENLTDEQRQSIEDALDRASGRATEVTFALRDDVIPRLEEIATEGKTEELLAAIQGVEEALRTGRLLGLSDEDIAAGLSGAAAKGDFQGLAELFENLDVKEGLVDPLNEAGDAVSERLLGPMVEANKEADEFAKAMREITSQEHRVRIALDVTAPTWLQPLLDGTGLGRIVRDNGGVVPGADLRTQIAGSSNPT